MGQCDSPPLRPRGDSVSRRARSTWRRQEWLVRRHSRQLNWPRPRPTVRVSDAGTHALVGDTNVLLWRVVLGGAHLQPRLAVHRQRVSARLPRIPSPWAPRGRSLSAPAKRGVGWYLGDGPKLDPGREGQRSEDKDWGEGSLGPFRGPAVGQDATSHTSVTSHTSSRVRRDAHGSGGPGGLLANRSHSCFTVMNLHLRSFYSHLTLKYLPNTRPETREAFCPLIQTTGATAVHCSRGARGALKQGGRREGAPFAPIGKLLDENRSCTRLGRKEMIEGRGAGIQQLPTEHLFVAFCYVISSR